LEEDLDFERVTKAVPVITDESVQNLEDRIKARILEGRYDDVVRIRPLDDKPFLPSRFLELKDTKSNQSLAQIYEDEYVAAQSGVASGSDRDGKLVKEHTEIDQLWENICHRLDALCNAHFIPKQVRGYRIRQILSNRISQPKATISTVENVSTVSMESALPSTHSVATMLAPEEIFAPSSIDAQAKSEMTPSEKRSTRLKLRKSKQKSRDTLNKRVDKIARMKNGGVKKEKQVALESIVKTGKGVTVVGKATKELMKGRKYKGRVEKQNGK
jgi:U3 small nucleolar RNA-associated protein MPP10